MPVFSIVIPVYNVEKYIDECLQSVIPQVLSFKYGAEIVLVDDGSTDRSGILCDEYQRKYPDFIKVVHNENQGLLLTRRDGYKAAKGTYIVNCDSDDKLAADMLEKLYDVIRKTNCDIVLFNIKKFNDNKDSEYYSNIFTNSEYCNLSIKEVMRSFFLDDIPVVTSMCGKCFRRSCLEINKDYSEFYKNSFGEDTVQSAELFSGSPTVCYLNKALYYYRVGSGMTAKCNELYYFNFKKVMLYVEKYKNKFNFKEFDDWFKVKFLKNAARSVTQFRYKKPLHYGFLKNKLAEIRDDKMFQNCSPYIEQYHNSFRGYYQVILFFLKQKYYWLIYLCLFLENRIK